jgi:hypothetical protein
MFGYNWVLYIPGESPLLCQRCQSLPNVPKDSLCCRSTVHFYEFTQFLQTAYNMCKSLASRGVANTPCALYLYWAVRQLTNSNCQRLTACYALYSSWSTRDWRSMTFWGGKCWALAARTIKARRKGSCATCFRMPLKECFIVLGRVFTECGLWPCSRLVHEHQSNVLDHDDGSRNFDWIFHVANQTNTGWMQLWKPKTVMLSTASQFLLKRRR